MNESEITIKDENGNDLKLVTAIIDINMSCCGCYFEKKSKCPAKLLDICTTDMCKSENSTIFVEAESDTED